MPRLNRFLLGCTFFGIGVLAYVIFTSSLYAAFWKFPPVEVSCAAFLKPYVRKMLDIHQHGTKWYFNQRRFKDYVLFLGQTWEQEVAQLPASEIWLDSGAGSGLALIDYLGQYEGHVVGLSAAVEKWDKYWIMKAMQRYKGRFDFYEGLLETPMNQWPQLAQGSILTDIYGPMSYTHAPDLVLAHYAALLRPGGKAWIFIPQNGLNLFQAAVSRQRPGRKADQPLTWRDYLAHGTGLVWLEEHLVQDPYLPFNVLGKVLAVQRTSEPFYLPALVAQVKQFKFNIPPQRSFRLADDPKK